jgi:hypothetical protein
LLSILEQEYLHRDATVAIGVGHRLSGQAQLGPPSAHYVLQVGVDVVHVAEPQIADGDQDDNEKTECQPQTNRDLPEG